MQIILLFTLDKYVLFWVIRTVKTEKNHVIFSTKRFNGILSNFGWFASRNCFMTAIVATV